MKTKINFKRFSLCLVSFLMLASCAEDQSVSSDEAANAALSFKKKDIPAMNFYALENGLSIDKYSTADPESKLNTAVITGLQANETILAIDFRPATGQLYGLGSTSRLYVINPETGTARAVGTAPFTPPLAGSIVGFDFNPTVDRIRIVTSSGQNLRLNPETGTVAFTDGTINGVEGATISGAAYANNVAGATTTTLYDIDSATKKLYKQTPPNNGTLVEVGDLGLKIEGEGGFDISYMQDVALGLYEVNKKATLFRVDLMTGEATILAKYNKNENYIGIAIQTQPVAYAVSGNNLLIFNPEMPSLVISKVITGVASGEIVLGLDFRPAAGQLYALGSTSRLYTINASSGVATAVGIAPFSTALSGTEFGFDFNPFADRARIVSNTGQNLRINPNDGMVTVDGMLNPATTGVTAAAYTNNFAGTTSTMLFDIDANSDKLYLQSPPNSGTLVEVGSLGINADAANGFDIGGTSGVAYAILTSGGTTGIYRINTMTGAATLTGSFASPVSGFTLGLGF